MGRKGDGVEIHGSAIRLSFTFDGRRRRELLMLNGQSMAPTAANMKYAHRVAQEIRERIRHGTFSMAEYFSASGTGGMLTVKGWLDTWLDTQSVENSTKAGYESAANFGAPPSPTKTSAPRSARWACARSSPATY